MSFNADRRGSSRGRWQTLAGWIVAAIGVAVFLGGNLGARIGFTFLPFDPHHAYAQLGGAAVAIFGVMWAYPVRLDRGGDDR